MSAPRWVGYRLLSRAGFIKRLRRRSLLSRWEAPARGPLPEVSRGRSAEPLEGLYRRFGPALVRRARALLGDDQEALDVMQDTFLAYMRTEASLRGEASAFTVLYQIATYKAVDRLRRKSRWSGVLTALEVEEDEVRPGPGAWAGSNEGGLARIEALRDLALLTEGEPPQALTAAVLYFAEGYTLQEAGEVLDLDRKKVSTLLQGLAARARGRSSRLQSGESS